ncbi:MAG TPA: HAD family hydrolase [Gammaproteobacteria bacterium]|nr:HAD family hydrolase [Gammaproteobacteria bacterium]
MALAIFDLDNTLLCGDSDYLWGQYLVEKGVVDADSYENANQRFYDEYKRGELDIHEFLQFSLTPLSEHDMTTLDNWHREFMQQKILPLITEASRKLVAGHAQRGDTLLIITATNQFVTAPIATELGIDNLLATMPEQRNGRYTGQVEGTPCFQGGKVERLQTWLAQHGHNMENSWFYSDSHNDLPLLLEVTHPVAVDPDDSLRETATQKGWPVISLHDDQPSS